MFDHAEVDGLNGCAQPYQGVCSFFACMRGSRLARCAPLTPCRPVRPTPAAVAAGMYLTVAEMAANYAKYQQRAIAASLILAADVAANTEIDSKLQFFPQHGAKTDSLLIFADGTTKKVQVCSAGPLLLGCWRDGEGLGW